MSLPTSSTIPDRAVSPRPDSDQDLEALVQPRLFHGHSVKPSRVTESRLKDNCHVCTAPFTIGKEINQFDCGHFIHSGCLQRMLRNYNGKDECGLCFTSITEGSIGEEPLSIEKHLDLAEKWCVKDGCFFKTGSNKSPDSSATPNRVIPDCPYPATLWGSASAAGFLHKYGRVLLEVIRDSMAQLDFKLQSHYLVGLTTDEQKSLRDEFDGKNDLSAIQDHVDTLSRKINQVSECAHSMKVSGKNRNKLLKAAGKMEQSLNPYLITESITELRRLMLAVSKEEKPELRGKNPSLKYISNSLKGKEYINGLSSVPEKKITICMKFERGRGGVSIINLESEALNSAHRKADKAFKIVRNIIKHVQFEIKVSQARPEIFNRSSGLYFERPFDYVNGKIYIGFSGVNGNGVESISLEKVVNEQFDDFNNKALAEELEKRGLDHEFLTLSVAGSDSAGSDSAGSDHSTDSGDEN